MPDSQNTGPLWLRQLTAILENAGDDVTSRFAQLATVDLAGQPANRTIVVREILPERGQLVMATDLRSRKIAQLQARPTGALCWYLSAARHQFRILGQVAILGDEAETQNLQGLRRKVWQSLGGGTQRTFYGPPPGSPRSEDAPATGTAERTPDNLPPASFGLLVLVPTTVDHLDLNPSPHARTQHRRQPDGTWRSTKINP